MRTVRYSQKKIALLWISEGGDPHKADEASAISMAESSGDTKAGNSCCHGLWQLNVEVGVSTMRCAVNPVCSTRKAISLSKNGQDWTPWEAFTNGAYRQFLGKGGVGDGTKFVDLKTPLGTVPAPGPNLDFTNPLGPLSPVNPLDGLPSVTNPFGGASLSNPLGGLEALSHSVNDMAAFFVGLGELVLTPEGWLRLAKLLGGAYLLLKGLNIVIRESTGADAAKAAKGTVSKVAETAAVVATVK